MRTFLILIGISLSFVVVLLASKPAEAKSKSNIDQDNTEIAPPVYLNAAVTVDSDVIVLGDLFQGAGEKAGTVVAYAPIPGKRAVFDARWLVRAASVYKLDWKPRTRAVQVVVERKTTIIGREEIETRLSQALFDAGETGAGEELQVQISNRMLRFYLPGDKADGIGIEDMNYDSISGRFAAIVRLPENDPAGVRHRITGRVHKMIRVPVLAERLLGGEVITEQNIKEVLLPARKVQRNVITDRSQILGLTPKRGLAAGRLIRSSDIQAPVLVPRRGLVTILLRHNNMTLTAQGRALENGSKGHVVRVLNTQSNKTIQAVVSGAGLVTVNLGNPELAENFAQNLNQR